MRGNVIVKDKKLTEPARAAASFLAGTPLKRGRAQPNRIAYLRLAIRRLGSLMFRLVSTWPVRLSCANS